MACDAWRCSKQKMFESEYYFFVNYCSRRIYYYNIENKEYVCVCMYNNMSRLIGHPVHLNTHTYYFKPNIQAYYKTLQGVLIDRIYI